MPETTERLAAHRALTATLAYAGLRSPDYIADRIRDRGITGQPDSTSDCPVGQWITRETGCGAVAFTWVGGDVTIYDRDGYELARTRIPHDHTLTVLRDLIADHDPAVADLADEEPCGEADRAEAAATAPL